MLVGKKKYKGQIVLQCQICGKDIYCYPSRVRVGKGKYCSRACHSLNPRKSHGMSKSRLYVIWCDMKSRCFNPRNVGFAYYGGRGIQVCSEWIDSFESFMIWALANGYSNGLELDRINADGNYSPENCRFATRKQQMCNTRKRRNAKTSKFKGVSRHSHNQKWIAQIHTSGVTTYLGSFDHEIEAAIAYDRAAHERFGEFANLNFPEGGGSR